MAERRTGEEFAVYVTTTEPTGYDADPSAYTVSIGDFSAVALVNSFSFDGSRNLADLTTWDDDDNGVFKAGRRERNIQFSGILDAEVDTGQSAFAGAFDSEGGEVWILIYPPAASEVVRHCKAIATGYGETYNQDEGVQFTASARVSGEFVRTTRSA